jgi:hypothetical protein
MVNQLQVPQQLNQLVSSLKTIQPLSLGNSETTQLITYTLIATAVVGIFVYHYLKNQEANG